MVTGWGNTQSATESRLKLRGAEVPIVNQEKCEEAYKRYGGITARMICAGFDQGGKDACQGRYCHFNTEIIFTMVALMLSSIYTQVTQVDLWLLLMTTTKMQFLLV